jgi:hypothetical protein
VAQHLESRKVMGMSSWSLFMISGLVIAKGAKKGNRSDTHEADGHGNVGVGVPGVAEAGAKVDIPLQEELLRRFRRRLTLCGRFG